MDFTVAPLLWLALALIVLVAAPSARAQRAFTARFSTNQYGNVTFAANTLMTLTNAANAAAVQAGTDPTAANLNNNNWTMQFVDADSDTTTTNSSRATLTLPIGATVLFAGLYWGADTNGTGSSLTSKTTAKFATPAASYTTVNASQTDIIAPRYQSFANVTAAVQAGGGGDYWVANVQAGRVAGNYAGWTLVVAYQSSSESARNLVVFDGFQNVSGAAVNVDLSGFTTPPAGAVNIRLGIVAYEGDRGTTGDLLKFGSLATQTIVSDAANPNNNSFNSSISVLGANVTTKLPNYINQLGFDADLFAADNYLTNGATSARINLTTTGDVYLPGVVTTAIEIYAPNLNANLGKSFVDLNGGNVEPGDTLEYVLTYANTGQDNATNVVVRDTLPPNVTYLTNSLVINGVAKTDTTGDDTADYISSTNTVIFRVGTSAGTTFGGTLAPGASGTTKFRVQVNVGAPDNSGITNFSTVTFTAQTLAQNYTGASTNSIATVITPKADVIVLKSGPTNAIAGTNISYTLTLTNAGPMTASNVVVRDTLPAGVTFVSASGGGAHSAGVVTWPALATLANGAATNYSVIITAPMTVTTLTNFAYSTSSSTDTNAANNDGSAAASRVLTVLTPVADMAMFKTGPTNASVGDPLTFTITLTNLGPHAASNVIASDTLPAGFTFVSASSGGTLSGSVVTWPALSSFANGATTNFTVNVTATTGGVQTNRASCTSLSSDPNPNNNNGTTAPFIVTVVVPYADIVAAKSGPATATTSGSITYTISVTNLGISTAQNVVVRDTLPAGVTFVSASSGGTHSAGVVTWPTFSGFLNGGVTNYTLNVTAPATAATLTNRVSSTSTTDDPDPANNSGSNSVGIVITTVTPPQADVAVFKSGPTNATVNDPLLFTIIVTNLGPSVSSNVIVRDTLPAGFTFVSATGGGIHSSGVITWPAMSSFGSGATTNFTINVTASVGGYQTNRAYSTANTADPDATNNDGNAAPGQVVTIVIPFADVTVAKTGPAIATVGNNLIYTIGVTNLGVSTALNVVVSDTLPAGVTFVSASGGGAFSAGVVTWPTIPGFPNGAWTNYTLTVTAAVVGSLTNVAHSTSTTSDPVPGNNGGTNAAAIAITTVNPGASGVLVSGFVYLDANKNLQKDNGEAGTGLTLFAKLIPASLPGGPATQAVVVATSSGQFVFSNTLAGAYSIVLDDNATLSDVTPTIPSGWTGTEMPEFQRGNVAVGGVSVPSQNFGLVNAGTFTGKVFKDTGTGGGTANDGAQNGGETGLPGVTVRLTDSSGATTYDTTTTDGSGNFRLLVPGALANGTLLKVVEGNPAGHISVGASLGNTGGSYDRASDTLAFTLNSGTSYSGMQFGDVPENTFVNDSQQSGLSGSFVIHSHTFIAGSGGQVAFTTASAPSPNLSGWSQVFYRDANCNGQIDPGEPALTAALIVVAGERVCMLVKDFIPLGAPLNAQNQITLTASFSYTAATPALATTHIHTDLTIVGTPTTAGLTLVKTVDKANALPGETLTYTITYANNGADVLNTVVIHDETPAFTTFVNAARGALPASLTAATITAPSVGNAGALRWTFTGTLAPGGASTVTFTVTLSP